MFFQNSTSKMSWLWNPGQRSLKVIQSGTIRQIACDFLIVFYRNFVPLRYSTSKNAASLKTGLGVRRGHWKCHHAIERTTSYWRSIVTMALSRVVSEIFNVENVVTLKSGSEVAERHRKYYSIDRAWFPISVFLVTLSLKRTVFEIFDL